MFRPAPHPRRPIAMRPLRAGVVLAAALLVAAPQARGDTLELISGAVLENCYIRDEGIRLAVWHDLAEVGGPPRYYPKSAVKSVKIERGADWDRKPDRPDLTVTFIEITPKLAGLHGQIQYGKFGRAWIEGSSPKLIDLGDEKYTDPQGAVKNLKLAYEPGETLTMTAHVKNIGFKAARPFAVEWRIDGEPLARDTHDGTLEELQEATFTQKWNWQPGFHEVTVRVLSDEEEIAKINNEVTDALWAFTFFYVVSEGRVDSWHEFRSAYGTFSFEDFYRWHIDIMNLLFENSIYPSAPDGIQARVRLDRIVYADYVKDNTPYIDGQPRPLVADDGIRYDQGGWYWNDSPEEIESGAYKQTDHTWRNQTEWSLPHELGHQLGLVDWYAIDYGGVEHHTWPDNGEKITHFQQHPEQMMHWHGPQLFGEVDAAYLNFTMDKPRGYFGDHYFSVPKECMLRVLDINGRPLPDAQVEIFQRGCVVDASQPAGEDHGVTYHLVVEDGNFYEPPVSKHPVIVGRTNQDGVLRLPNRPAKEVVTLNGFHRTDNPFGNMNVVGPRNLMLAKITKDGRSAYFWLEQYDFCVAWFRGQRERYVQTLRTPFGSVDSPPPPADVQVERLDEHHVKVTWKAPELRERHYLDHAIGYKVYRRIGNDGLNDRPWFEVATLGPDAREATIDLRQFPQDVYWFAPRTERFGVTTLAATSRESELSETLQKP